MKRPIRRLNRTPQSGPITRPAFQCASIMNRCSRYAACRLCALCESPKSGTIEDAGANALSDSCIFVFNGVMLVFVQFYNQVQCCRVGLGSQGLHTKADHSALDCKKSLDKADYCPVNTALTDGIAHDNHNQHETPVTKPRPVASPCRPHKT